MPAYVSSGARHRNKGSVVADPLAVLANIAN
jgi:hypothetical protein